MEDQFVNRPAKQVEVAKLDAAIDANLKEFGYGG